MDDKLELLLETTASELLAYDKLELLLETTTSKLLVDDKLELLLETTASELLVDDEIELLIEVAAEDVDGSELPPPPPHAVNIAEVIVETKKQAGFFFMHRVLFVEGSFIEGGDPNIDTMQFCVPKVLILPFFPPLSERPIYYPTSGNCHFRDS